MSETIRIHWIMSNKVKFIPPYVKKVSYAVRTRDVVAILAVILVAFGTIAGWKRSAWLPQAIDRVRFLLTQRECLQYAPAPDVLVYTNDPVDITKLRYDSHYTFDLARPWPPTGPPPGPCALFHSGCYSRLEGWVPSDLTYFPDDMSHPGTVFMHERRTMNGASRLVLVECAHVFRLEFRLNFPYEYAEITWSTATSVGYSGQLTWKNQKDAYGRRLLYNRHVFGPMFSPDPFSASGVPAKLPARERIFAGQIDPNDPAAFTIRCQYDGKDWFIDGRLIDVPGGDVTVTLTMRGYPGPPE